MVDILFGITPCKQQRLAWPPKSEVFTQSDALLAVGGGHLPLGLFEDEADVAALGGLE